MKSKILKKTIDLISYAMGIITIVLLCYGYYYISELENQISERDKVIQNLSFRSYLVDEYFDIEVDSTKNTTSYILKDSKKARIIEKRTEHIKTTIEVHDKELISNYKKLADEYNSIVVENSNNKRLISEQRAVLELIERNYQIKYKVSVDSIYTRTKLFNTERIDSALLLLPYYRDRIKKVDDKTWTISVQK